MSQHNEGPGADDIIAESLAYRRLAMRVIERALRDVAPQASSARERRTAHQFLRGSAMLFHWCRVAMLDPRRVIASAIVLENQSGAALTHPVTLSGHRRRRV